MASAMAERALWENNDGGATVRDVDKKNNFVNKRYLVLNVARYMVRCIW